MKFKLSSTYQATGDQPAAIESLVNGCRQGKRHQVLLGVTGSGKTFTIANVIERLQRPVLVIAHNKTLAAQLYQEFRDYFPDNAVSYFVSYYDYYQPEAYLPSTDTYIEKDTSINDEIDKLRLATTTNLITRRDVIVVASVSCIYNLGSPVEYGRQVMEIVEGMLVPRRSLLLRLSDLQYERTTTELRRGSFRVRGDTIQLWPAYEEVALSIDLLENKIERFDWIDPVSGTPLGHHDRPLLVPDQPVQAHPDQPVQSKRASIYPARHYLVDPKSQQQAIAEIEQDLERRLLEMRTNGKTLEAYRLQQKVRYDLEMIGEFGFVNGIENYSRYFDGRQPGQPPYSLLEYFRENTRLFKTDGFLTVIDESHMTIP
ncbi:MAG: excinuclease ABC subunit B, partial [Candidatus Pacebacteria bacterium CG10_big_fil_rev_8_21_14_0_10_56_10]